VRAAIRAGLGAAGMLALIGAAPATRPAAFQAWLTTGDGAQRMAPITASAPAADAIPVVVDPARRFQTMVGFGAAITDASAITLTRMKPDQRAALMRELFGNGPGDLHLGFTRLTIGASDFSPGDYSLDDPPGNRSDPALRYFSIAPNREAMLPIVRQARAINPQLTVMASPWSPPGWMKSGGSMIGGTLKPDLYPVYARYFVRWVQDYAAAGVPIRYLTIQNEPGFEPKDYPGMLWPAAGRARFIADYLGPALAAGRARRSTGAALRRRNRLALLWRRGLGAVARPCRLSEQGCVPDRMLGRRMESRLEERLQRRRP
jgi:glucosylceramidase